MNRSSFARFAIGPIGAGLLGLVSLPACAWLFSVADIGRIALLQTVTGLCIIVFSLGLDQGYVREYHQTKDRARLFKLALLPGLGLLLVAQAFVLLEPAQVARALFGSDDGGWTLLALLMIAFAFCSRFLSLILRMEERGLAFSMSQILPKLLFLAALLWLYLQPSTRGFADLLFAHVVAVVAATLVFAWNTRRTWQARAAPSEPDSHTLRRMLAFSTPLMVAGLASWGVEAMDKVLLRALATFDQLGVYSVAAGIASVAGTLSVIFTTVWIPTAYRWSTEPDCEAKVWAVAHKLIGLGVLMVAAAGSFAWLIGLVLPAEYFQVQYLVCTCMLPPIFYAIGEVTGIGTGIVRKTTPIMLGSVAACAVNLVANMLLIPALGARGAAISTTVAFVVLLAVRTEASIRYWSRTGRGAIYGPVLGIATISVAYSLTGSGFPAAWQVIWLSVMAATAFAYRRHLGVVFAHLVPGRSPKVARIE